MRGGGGWKCVFVVLPLTIRLWMLCVVAPSSRTAQISGSLARLAVKMLEEEGKIRAITKHSKQWLYTRATNVV